MPRAARACRALPGRRAGRGPSRPRAGSGGRPFALIGFAFTAAVCLSTHGARAALPDRAYTFGELLDRAESILVAEVRGSEGAEPGTPLREGLLAVREVLKGNRLRAVEEVKAAADDGTDIEDEVRVVLPFRVDGPPLPAGAKAIWFLTAPGPDGVFVIDHPQCAYDLVHRAIVEIGIEAPERIRPGYYLRREDEKLAESVLRAREKRALARVRPGPSPEGLELRFETAEPVTRAGDGVLGRFTLTNGGRQPLVVCDSAQECYFVVATSGFAERPVRPLPAGREAPGPAASGVEVAKAGAPEIRGLTRLGIGLLISEHDFTTLAPGGKITRSLTLSPTYLRALCEPGEVRLRGVYHFRRPAAPLVSLPETAWEGSVASEPVKLEVLPALGR